MQLTEDIFGPVLRRLGAVAAVYFVNAHGIDACLADQIVTDVVTFIFVACGLFTSKRARSASRVLPVLLLALARLFSAVSLALQTQTASMILMCANSSLPADNGRCYRSRWYGCCRWP